LHVDWKGLIEALTRHWCVVLVTRQRRALMRRSRSSDTAQARIDTAQAGIDTTQARISAAQTHTDAEWTCSCEAFGGSQTVDYMHKNKERRTYRVLVANWTWSMQNFAHFTWNPRWLSTYKDEAQLILNTYGTVVGPSNSFILGSEALLQHQMLAACAHCLLSTPRQMCALIEIVLQTREYWGGDMLWTFKGCPNKYNIGHMLLFYFLD
jgi:hypothetical protein